MALREMDAERGLDAVNLRSLRNSEYNGGMIARPEPVKDFGPKSGRTVVLPVNTIASGDRLIVPNQVVDPSDLGRASGEGMINTVAAELVTKKAG